MPNPLKADPSRTTTLRRQYEADMRRRFARVRRAITYLLVNDDAFGMAERPALKLNAQQYDFPTDSAKLEAFHKWLEDLTDKAVLRPTDSPTGGSELEQVLGTAPKPWQAKYVDSAYRKGFVRSYTEVRPPAGASSPEFYAGGRQQFLRDAFSAPERLDKLKLLYTRNFENLKGITQDMSAKLGQVLAEGLAAGHHPRKVAKRMAAEIEGITNKRAILLARTEIIHAHAEGQLDGFEDLGVEELELLAEFLTAGDSRVCPRCQALAGRRFTVAEARGIIPVHPLCRCVWAAVTGAHRRLKRRKAS